MNAILVSVDFADLLAVTLPYNRHHFDRVLIVTTPGDVATLKVAQANRAMVYQTESFYADGAVFNKWLPLEEGITQLRRFVTPDDHWLCIMDADILWPQKLRRPMLLNPGCLYTPLRHMIPQLPNGEIPPESEWANYPLHRQQREWAGYTQIFSWHDPHLGPLPWHQTNWRHAGGADSFFQQKWDDAHKLRPPFNVLHIGESGKNWCGRATPYLDGTVHPDSAQRIQQVRDFIGSRRHRAADPFANEKISR